MDEESVEPLPEPCEECSRTIEEPCEIDGVHCRTCCTCTRCPNCSNGSDNLCSNCENCNSCCECETCHAYRRVHRVDSTCSNCTLCSDHCECYVCNACGDRVSDCCGECERCDDCGCRCSNGESPRFHGDFTYLGEPTKDMPRYTSLELEYAACQDAGIVETACAKWRDYCVEDGSLPDDGFEINTNPSRGSVYAEHIRSIIKACNSADTEHSTECGMHVHVDARDLNWHDIHKLALLYSRVEKALFAMQPASRQGNPYCIEVRDRYNLSPNGFKHAFLNSMYRDENYFPKNRKERKPYTTTRNGKRVFTQRAEKYHSNRYYALNLHTWFYRGTVEFRHACSTLNGTKAVNWGLLCMWIVEKASTMTFAQIKDMPLANDKVVATKNLLSIVPKDLGIWILERQSVLRR